jgi:hypothetical protein
MITTVVPSTLALAHGVLTLAVILVIGLPILLILVAIWYVQKM